MRPADPDFAWHPPAAAGDLLRLLPDPPATLCLIDGYFDARPSVWHKEILLLIEAGVRVFGAASMGALRAAELDRLRHDRRRRDLPRLSRRPAARRRRGRFGPRARRAWLAAGERTDGRRPRDLGRRGARAIHVRRRRAQASRPWRDPSISATAIGRPSSIEPAGPRTTHPTLRAWLGTGAVRLKQSDALACLALARTVTQSAPGSEPTPITCFVRNLARECGVPLPR